MEEKHVPSKEVVGDVLAEQNGLIPALRKHPELFSAIGIVTAVPRNRTAGTSLW